MAQKLWQAKAALQLPSEVRRAFVTSLFQQVSSLAIGSTAATIGTFLAAWKTGEENLVFIGAATAAVAMSRLYIVRLFKKKADPETFDMDIWERRYQIGAVLYVGLLGLFCFVSFVETTDSFSQLVSFAITIAYMIGVCGRNYASERLVLAQIVAAGLPLSVGVVLAGGYNLAILVLVLVPFFLALVLIARSLRGTLLTAVVNGHEVAKLAERFDAAVRHMPAGLAFFDGSGTLAVTNPSLTSIFPGADAARELDVEQFLANVAEPQIASDSDRQKLRDLCAQSGAGAAVRTELEMRNGRMVAVTVRSIEEEQFVLLCEDITSQKEAEAQLRQLATFDPLTSLLNRKAFEDEITRRLRKAAASGDMVELLFIDLDDFKQVNDMFGHSVGDEVLRTSSTRLFQALSPNDCVARFGGDEFVVCLDAGCAVEASVIAEKLIECLSRPILLAWQTITISASIGITSCEAGMSSAEELLKRADTALYAAKGDGKGTCRAFVPAMEEAVRARHNLEACLRAAIEEEDFTLAYQPLYDIASGRVRTVEALLRWSHPELGDVSPATFIPILEEIGKIPVVGDIVLRQACNACRSWPDNVRVAVNLSPLQFRQGAIAQDIVAALAECNLSGDRLEVEITESVLLQDSTKVREELASISRLGVQISLDDFGTGYSSLSYLSRIAIDKIKIDQSFLRNMTGRGRDFDLIANIARLSSDMGLKVVAEGIETERQLELMMQIEEIREIQGYLFSKPLSAEMLMPLLARYAGGSQRWHPKAA